MSVKARHKRKERRQRKRLAKLIRQVNASIAAASSAIDDAIAYVEASRERIAEMEGTRTVFRRSDAVTVGKRIGIARGKFEVPDDSGRE